VGLKWGPLSLVSTIEELLDRKISGCGLGNQQHGHRDPSCSPRGILYPQKLALISPPSGGRSLGRYISLADSGHGVSLATFRWSFGRNSYAWAPVI
jgi:hypothetical protein